MTRRTGLLVLGVTMLTCSTGLSVPLEDPKRETKTDGNPAVVSPDGKTAVTAKGGVITISEVRGDNVVVRAKIKQRGNVNCLAISPDGKLLISGGDNISFFDMATGKTVIRINAGSPVVKLQLSADGTLLTSTHEDGKSRLFDSRTGKLLRVSE